LIKNSQPFGKTFQKIAGGGIFLTHTVYLSSGACTVWRHRVYLANDLKRVSDLDARRRLRFSSTCVLHGRSVNASVHRRQPGCNL